MRVAASWSSMVLAAAMLTVAGSAYPVTVLAGASGDEEQLPPTGPGPIDEGTADDGRYALRVMYQPERDLNNADPHINVLIDTRTGRSWVLRYVKMPDSHERGYVWVEVPFAAKPEQLPGN